MKERLTNNLLFKIISILFAIFLWWAVVNIDDPISSKNFRAEVQLQNDDLITNDGKCYQIVGDTKSVSVRVKARRSVVEKIKSTDIILTADVREMQNNMIPIRVHIKGYEGNYEEATTNPRNVVIRTEEIATKTFTVVPTTKGDVGEGYVLGELKLNSKWNQIEISGPQSAIGIVNRVEAVVNVNGMTSSDTRIAELVYYDSADSEIERSQITSSLDSKKVKVEIEILKLKEVELEFDTSAVQLHRDYFLSGIEVQPEMVIIVGTEEQLQNLDKLQIGSEALQCENLQEKTNVEVDIVHYLPQGIQLKDELNSKIVVTLLVERDGTKSLHVPVRSIKVVNAPEGYEYSYGPQQEVELIFAGSAKQLEELTLDDIEVVLDLKDCNEGEGTYTVYVQVLDAPEWCEYVGEASTDIILTKIKDAGE